MITKEDVEYLKEFFVTHQQCQNSQEEIKAQTSVIHTTTAVTEVKVSHILWLIGVTMSSAIAILVKVYFLGGVG